MEVVDLAVEDQAGAGVGVDHRLVGGGREVEDRQPAMGEQAAPAAVVGRGGPGPLAVGPAVAHRRGHPGQGLAVAIVDPADDPGDAAHGARSDRGGRGRGIGQGRGEAGGATSPAGDGLGGGRGGRGRRAVGSGSGTRARVGGRPGPSAAGRRRCGRIGGRAGPGRCRSARPTPCRSAAPISGPVGPGRRRTPARRRPARRPARPARRRCSGDPALALGLAEGDEQQVRPGVPDLGDQPGLLLVAQGAERRAADAGDDQAGVEPLEPPGRRLGHAGGAAEEEDAVAPARRPGRRGRRSGPSRRPAPAGGCAATARPRPAGRRRPG